MILKFKNIRSSRLKFPISMLEFRISYLSDIRFLVKAWKKHLAKEGLESTKSILVNVTVDDRRPEEEVGLQFTAAQEVLDRFLGFLEKEGFKLSRTEIIPGLITMYRVEHERF